MVALKDHIQVVVVLDVLDPVCVCTLSAVKIKTWTIDLEESYALAHTHMHKNTHTLHTYARIHTHSCTHRYIYYHMHSFYVDKTFMYKTLVYKCVHRMHVPPVAE